MYLCVHIGIICFQFLQENSVNHLNWHKRQWPAMGRNPMLPAKSDGVLKKESRTHPSERRLQNCTYYLHAILCTFILGKFAGSERNHSTSHKDMLSLRSPCWGGWGFCLSGAVQVGLWTARCSLCSEIRTVIWIFHLDICIGAAAFAEKAPEIKLKPSSHTMGPC